MVYWLVGLGGSWIQVGRRYILGGFEFVFYYFDVLFFGVFLVCFVVIFLYDVVI